MNENYRIVVLGASAGGLPALIDLVGELPADLPAALFVVLHLRDDSFSFLPEILDRAGPLPAIAARDGETIAPGTIYVAVPGHHLLVEEGRLAVKAGPRENRFRPSIDALFRSAAYAYRERVVGVVLSGMLSDGTSGLWTVKRFGGVSVVQEPSEAAFDSMPRSAIEEVDVDHVLPASEIARLIRTLSREPVKPMGLPDDRTVERTRTEVAVAGSESAFNKGIMDFGELTPFTCPDCHGALVRIVEGRHVRYRCHTGHGFSANALLSGVTDSIEASLWNTLRAMDEGVMLLEHMASHFAEIGRANDAVHFKQKAEETRLKARLIQQKVVQSEHLSEDNIVGRTPALMP